MTMEPELVRPHGDGEAPGRYRGARQRSLERAERLARGIGWLSLGLGLAQLAAPKAAARMVGARGDRRGVRAMRGIAAREIVTGIGILMRPEPAGWLWARVGGDLTDLGLMSTVLVSTTANRSRAKGAMMAIVGITIADALAGRQLGRHTTSRPRRRPTEPMTESITVNRSPEDLYRFWRDLQNLPRFMSHVRSVQAIDERRSRWTVRGPGERSMSLDVEITDDRPGERIGWRSCVGAEIETHGVVRFVRAPGDRGTEVHLQMSYETPGGVVGRALTRLVGGVIRITVGSDLHRLKQLMELGEVVQSDASVHRGPHPAQPPEERPRARAGNGAAEPQRETSASRGGGA